MSKNTTAILLLNMGGPDSPEAVEPFLVNLFSDPDIIQLPFGVHYFQKNLAQLIAKRRAEKVQSYYRKIGGKSPLTEITQKQAKALEEALKPHGDYRVFTGMRYWHPLIEATLREIIKSGIRKIIALPLYPQYSITTTGSSFNELKRSIRKMNVNYLSVSYIDHWYDEPGYIEALTATIRETRKKCSSSAPILFSAHGLPQKVIDGGDPYQYQTEETVRRVMEKLGPAEYYLSYQSKVGPAKWLEPATDKFLAELAAKGVRDLLMVPISFVADNSETSYEMDILYREKAAALGMTSFYRVPCLNDRPELIETLKSLVLKTK